MKQSLEKYKVYANAVQEGKIVACEYVKLATKRYLDWFNREDLEFKSEIFLSCCNESLSRLLIILSNLLEITATIVFTSLLLFSKCCTLSSRFFILCSI